MSIVHAICNVILMVKDNSKITSFDMMAWALFSIADALWLLLIWKVVAG